MCVYIFNIYTYIYMYLYIHIMLYMYLYTNAYTDTYLHMKRFILRNLVTILLWVWGLAYRLNRWVGFLVLRQNSFFFRKPQILLLRVMELRFYEKEMATHSSVLAWRIPGTAEPGGLLSMGSHRVGHDWSDLAAAAAAAAATHYQGSSLLLKVNSKW